MSKLQAIRPQTWAQCFSSPGHALACAKSISTVYPQAAAIAISGPSKCGKCGTERKKDVPYLTHLVLNDNGDKIEGGLAQNGIALALAQPLSLPPSGLLPAMIISGRVRTVILSDISQARGYAAESKYTQQVPDSGNLIVTLPPTQQRLVILINSKYNPDIETDLMHARHVKSLCGGPEYVYDLLTNSCIRITEASPASVQRQSEQDRSRRLQVLIEPCNALGRYTTDKRASAVKSEPGMVKPEPGVVKRENYNEPEEDLLVDERKFCIPFHDGSIVGVANNDLSRVVIFRQPIPVRHIELIQERGLRFDQFPKGSGPQQEFLWNQLYTARRDASVTQIDNLIWPNEQVLKNIPITNDYAPYLVEVQQTIGKTIQLLPDTCRGNTIIYERGRCRQAKSALEQTRVNDETKQNAARVLYVRRNPRDGMRYMVAYWNEQGDFIVPTRPILWIGPQMLDQPIIQVTPESKQALDSKVAKLEGLPAGTVVEYPQGGGRGIAASPSEAEREMNVVPYSPSAASAGGGALLPVPQTPPYSPLPESPMAQSLVTPPPSVPAFAPVSRLSFPSSIKSERS